jgi:hypothetical protein
MAYPQGKPHVTDSTFQSRPIALDRVREDKMPVVLPLPTETVAA